MIRYSALCGDRILLMNFLSFLCSKYPYVCTTPAKTDISFLAIFGGRPSAGSEPLEAPGGHNLDFGSKNWGFWGTLMVKRVKRARESPFCALSASKLPSRARTGKG